MSGEAGIGKTALVQHVVSTAPPELVRLSAPCLPLQSLSVPLLPLRTAVRASAAPSATIAACLAAMEDGNPIIGVESFLAEVLATAPVVLVVDDLQWADQSTLDVLLYLVAGRPDQRLAVLATVRTEHRPPGHPLTRWLADVLRLPRVSQLELGLLDRSATDTQLGQLLGGIAHQSLVDDVFRATRGHPYFTRLLAHNLDPTTRRLPGHLPSNLTLAIRQTWQQCSSPTRAVTSLLAVAGRPQTLDALQQVADELDIGAVPPALAEAEEAGLVEVVTPDRFWFHHPLQDQVLERALTEPERRRWHAAYARLGDQAVAAGALPTVELALAQAEHHERAGATATAYHWALRAWDVAAANRGLPELLGLMRRAIRLRSELADATETIEDLWDRVRTAAAAAGADADELTAIEALLEIIDETEQPLRVSELLVRRMLLRLSTAVQFFAIEDMRRAVELAAVEPTSWQYALALAELAHAGVWADDAEAPGRARHALALARAAGHPTALTFALTASAMVEVTYGRPEGGLALATEAVAAAVVASDWWAFVHATMWEDNARLSSDRESADLLRRRREQLAALGAPHVNIAQLSAVEAESLLMVGNWSACQDRLRVTLGSDPGPFADVRSRLIAARLAAQQGRVAEATAHLERVDELLGGDPARYRNLNVDATRATVLLEAGRPAEAYQAALAGATEPGVPVDMCEWLLPLAARALADLAQQAQDGHRNDDKPLQRLAELRERFPTVLEDSGVSGAAVTERLVVMQAWYDAETSRARRLPGSAADWLQVARLGGQAQLAWVEVYAWWRAGEELLGRGADGRTEGVRVLRQAFDLADRLGAGAVRRNVVELARSARVRLESTASVPPTDPMALPGLTRREREILEHLVRGSTYAEIAAALFLSEKTVSSHISNMLRKTGTSSRVELSRRATRVRKS